MKIHTSINEFLGNSPKTSPTTKPGVAPTKPGTRPSPSPIRRTRPSVSPNPKAETDFQTATEDDIISRFVDELRSSGGTIRINKKYKK